MIVAFASRKGSPGVTTVAALVAARWQQPDCVRLVVEADRSGGTLAARWSAAHGLTWDPGLLDLSATRSSLGDRAAVEALTQPVAEGVRVAAAPPSPEQVDAALGRFGDAGAAAMAAAPWLRAMVDCGRLDRRSAALPLALRAVLTVLLCRPRLDEIQALVPAVAELRAVGCSVGLVCVGDRPYEPGEVADAARVPLLGVLPVDERGGRLLDDGGLWTSRRLRRSPLYHAAGDLTEVIRSQATAPSPTATVWAPPAGARPEPRPQPSAAPPAATPLEGRSLAMAVRAADGSGQRWLAAEQGGAEGGTGSGAAADTVPGGPSW